MSLLKLPAEVIQALERLDRVEENLDAIRAGVERLVELEEANRGSGP